MEAYFIMLSVPSMLAMLAAKKKQTYWIAAVFLLFVFLIGFRLNVGMDWNNYEYTHSVIKHESPGDILLSPEPFSSLLFWASANMNVGTLLSNVVAAAILMLGVLSFAMRTPNPWLAVVAATPYLIIAFGMSGIRQAMAAGIVLFTLSVWEQVGTSRKSAGMVAASLFHTSALMGVLFVLWDIRLRFAYKLGFAIIVSALVYFVSRSAAQYTGNLQFYQDAYLVGERAVASPGALFHIALVAIPAGLYLVNRRRFQKYLQTDRLMLIGTWMVVGVSLLFFASSTGASRLTLYLYFLPMTVFSVLPQIFHKRQRLLIVGGIVAFHFVILASWLFFANNSFAHIPYRNIIFE